jgi:hypothetical protein
MYSQIITTGADQAPKIIIHSKNFPDAIYDYSNVPYIDVKPAIGLSSYIDKTEDSAVGDFNGDLLPDIMLARSIEDASQAHLVDPTTVVSAIFAKRDEKGFSIRSDGAISVTIGPRWRIDLEDIHIGSQSAHPISHQFELSPSDPVNTGISPHQPGVDSGIFIGYEPNTNEWQFLFSTTLGTDLTAFKISSQESIESLTTIGFTNTSSEMPVTLLLQNGHGFSLT